MRDMTAKAKEKDSQSMICINCPKGCRMNIRLNGSEWSVSRHDCPRGEQYALQELTDPQRVLTALMRPKGTHLPVSVKTDRPVPKAKLMECAAKLYQVHPQLPIAAGDVLIENLCGTGARVIATRAAK